MLIRSYRAADYQLVNVLSHSIAERQVNLLLRLGDAARLAQGIRRDQLLPSEGLRWWARPGPGASPDS